MKNILQVFRFMSMDEFTKFNNGEILHNNTIHKAKTTSTGFCFFSLKDYKPHEAMHFLCGLVNFNICAVFEVDKNKLKESYGVYHKIKEPTEVGNLFLDIIRALYNREWFTATEYCTTEYSNKDFKLLKFAEDIWSQYEPIEEQKELKWEGVR